MKDTKQLTVRVGPKLFMHIYEECDDNGWMMSVPLKIGLECFLSASRENRIALLKQFNKRMDKEQ